MNASSLDGLTIEIEYLAQVNWSLMRSAIPLILKFCIRSTQDTTKNIILELSISKYLAKTVVHVSSRTILYESDLSGQIHLQLGNNWEWLRAWELDLLPTATTLRLQVENIAIDCPITILPPTYWHRVQNVGSRMGGRLATKKGKIHFSETGIETLFEDSFIDWTDTSLPFPPLEAALAALIDPNDSYVREDGPEDSLGWAVYNTILLNVGDPLRVARRDISPSVALKSFYMTVLHARHLRHLDFLHEFTFGEQSVRLLKSDRERGVLCLDLVCLGCEIFEALGLRPIFILTEDGKHAVLGLNQDVATFSENQPVCVDPEKLKELVEQEKLLILDVTLALSNMSYSEAQQSSSWSQLSRGFMHAVDIKAIRSKKGGWQFAIHPLPRPKLASDWVPRYVQRLLQENQTPQAAESGDLNLHDPTGLFISIKCQVQGEAIEIRPVLNTLNNTGWLVEKAVEQPGRIALLGNGGAGKSYICQRLAMDMARTFISHRPPGENGEEEMPPVPILYSLRQLGRNESENLLVTLARWVGCAGPDDLMAATTKYRLLFILDGLDESDFGRRFTLPQDYIRLLQPVYELDNSSVLLTARPALFPGDPTSYLPGFDIAGLLSWDEHDFNEFLYACETIKHIEFEGGRQQFYQSIFGSGGSANLQELARTPLFARLIVETRKQIQNVQSELDLYRQYTRTCFERRQEQLPVTEAEEITREIAFSMYLQRKDVLKAEDIAQELAFYLRRQGIDIYRQILARDIIVHGLLVKEELLLYRFSHLSIEHYFLAEKLALEMIIATNSKKIPKVLAHAPFADGVIDFLAQIFLADAEVKVLENLSANLAVRKELRRNCIVADRSGRTTSSKISPELAFRNLCLVFLRAGRSLLNSDLRELDLSGSNLTGAKLGGSDLGQSKLRGCVLVAADLRGCMLKRADLREADLTGTILMEADFDHCQLSYIKVRDYKQLPQVCQAKNLDTVIIDKNDPETFELLWQAITICELTSDFQNWAEQLRGALKERFLAGDQS